ncbi:hypothetical protein CVT26_007755 [Gymnopilus dilepis]|uniref:Uncharacterized protein n=1 Tax=Gymnopilus dilepis TaxID=231916 RepID=A0A409X148_9AGAR|nr:hypothetical protein CVT26_007755 [Gymnopilus dilepis]
MRTILYVLLSSTSINLVCKALPLPAVHDWYNYDARDADDLVRIEARSHGSHHVLMPVGPGARYPEDDPSHAQSTRLYHPIPPNTYFQTAEHFWTHHDVNAQANQLMGALDHAPTAHCAAPPRRGGRFTVGFTKAKKRVGEFFKKRFGKKKN